MEDTEKGQPEGQQNKHEKVTDKPETKDPIVSHNIPQEQQIQRVVTGMSITHSSPLPSASEFAGYEKAFPGAADRILTLAEKRAKHSQDMERKTTEASIDVRNKALQSDIDTKKAHTELDFSLRKRMLRSNFIVLILLIIVPFVLMAYCIYLEAHGWAITTFITGVSGWGVKIYLGWRKKTVREKKNTKEEAAQ